MNKKNKIIKATWTLLFLFSKLMRVSTKYWIDDCDSCIYGGEWGRL